MISKAKLLAVIPAIGAGAMALVGKIAFAAADAELVSLSDSVATGTKENIFGMSLGTTFVVALVALFSLAVGIPLLFKLVKKAVR